MMIETKQIKVAYLEDIKTKPYFLRDLESPSDKFIYTLGYEMLYELSVLFQDKVLQDKKIELIYTKIWNSLESMLDIKTQFFQLYFEYLQDIMNFYKDLCEVNENFEVAENIKKIINRFDRDTK